MKERSQRGAARISAIWMIVMIVMFFVALSFGYLSSQDAQKFKVERDEARADAAKEIARAAEAFQDALAITAPLGFNDDSVTASLAVPEAAKDALDNLKQTFTDLDATVVNFEDALPILISQYNNKLAQIRTLEGRITDLEGQIRAERETRASVASTKDTQIQDVQKQLTDAEASARDEKARLEGTIATRTQDRDDKDTQLRTKRGELDDLAREGEKERTQATIRHRTLTDLLSFVEEPPTPDGEVLEVSKELGIGWINLGRKHRLSRGIRFEVVSGNPARPDVKGMAIVTNVKENMAEVTFSNPADPFDPIVPGDLLFNPLFNPKGEYNAILIGRFSGTYNEKELKLLLADIGITVQDKADLTTAYMIVGNPLFVDEDGEPTEEPILPSELSAYKDAEALGVNKVSIRDLRRFFRR